MAEQAVSVQERVSERPLREQAQTEPSPAATLSPSSPTRRPHLLLPGLASAGLFYLCYFPVAWGFLGWVALVPLLALVRAGAPLRRILGCAYLAGSAFFWPILSWMPVADNRMYATWAMLAVYCSLYFPVAILLLRWLDRGTRLTLIVTVPVVWVGLEFIRSFLLTGFAWYYLGHTQHDYLAMIQITDLGGVYLVSLVLAAGNAWLFEVLYACGPLRHMLRLPGGSARATATSARRLAVQGAVVACLIAATLGYGAYRLSEEPFKPGPRLALLQGSLDQRIRNVDLSVKNAEAAGAQAEIYNHYGNLDFLARTLPLEADLIVWPETSYPDIWVEIAPNVSMDRIPRLRDEALHVRELLKCYASGKHPLDPNRKTLWRFKDGKPLPPANLLLGICTQVVVTGNGKLNKYNSALMLYKEGKVGDRYDKIHRVPFGEYVPLRESLPFMNRFAPYESDYSISQGKHLTRFQLDQYRFGVLICYEDTDPFLARPYGVTTADGPPVDFLVNISNDGWFDGSSEHDEHLAICRFRAIEARRSVARAVNMGISAIIDSNGRVRMPRLVRDHDPLSAGKAPNLWIANADPSPEDLPVSQWANYKKAWGILVADVPIDSRTSLYSQWGDWLPHTCWAVVGVGLVWAAITLRRRRVVVVAGGVA